MPIAAVPEYLGSDFSDASPALRFGMYLKLWGVDARSKKCLWTRHDANYRRAGRDQSERCFKDENKTSALCAATSLSKFDRKSMVAHIERQRAIFDALGENEALELMAQSVAPFTTGLGNEHPLENGFAFLNPYGLPYLPGSGVKGIVRRAAEELAHPAFFQDKNWTLPIIWHLFGFEPWLVSKGRASDAEWKEWIAGFAVSKEEIDTYLSAVLDDSASDKRRDGILESASPLHTLLQDRNLHVRGALEFWDVVPQISGNKLAVDVMTPHQSRYYDPRKSDAGSKSPHDSGQPIPINFLTVPPGSDFVFHVRCDHRHLSRCAPELAGDDRWRTLLKAAFEHAFEWLGFGAKTVVGYGAMERNHEGEARYEQQREDRERVAREQAESERAERQARVQEDERLAALSPVEREVEAVIRERKDKGLSEVVVVIQAAERGRWDGDAKIEVAKWLHNRMQSEGSWKETSAKKKPEKDQVHQRTLRVKQWLGG